MTCYSLSHHEFGTDVVHPEGFPSEENMNRDSATLLCEALNVHEATGLTPAQLQARVAELEEAVLKLSADVQIARGGVQQLKDFANQYPSRITPAVNTVVDSILEATA